MSYLVSPPISCKDIAGVEAVFVINFLSKKVNALSNRLWNEGLCFCHDSILYFKSATTKLALGF